MIILIKQLLDESFSIEKIQLTPDPLLQIAQIIDFDIDLIVCTSSNEAMQTIELAKLSRISFALSRPDLEVIAHSLEVLKHHRYRHMHKMLFLEPNMLDIYADLLEQISEEFTLVLEGDFQQAYEHMVFDIKEAELDFCMDYYQ